MNSVMVTGRMSEEKKARGLRVLEREGLNVSQAINALFDRMIEAGNAAFLVEGSERVPADRWKEAAAFIDELSSPRSSRFDSMSKAEIKRDRLAARELL
ncbi:MAG: RelB/DinJ family addiction module antitoxin [Eggerthellaceae bacterium]|nr:RelB/DinJ family addiction module antitoxin [Eggerthellaceae bacterium]